ncbi:823_t:CDS:2, partial [Ambispora leptoticha]
MSLNPVVAIRVEHLIPPLTAKFMKDDDDILTTYCGSPITSRNEDRFATTEERNGLRVEFHNRYWRNISSD